MLKDLEKTLDFSQEVASFSEFLRESTGNLERLSSELEKSMEEIHKMGGLIQQIGERIVVLSINSSIEGSRETIDRQAIKALADEIGELSETTTKRVSEIFTSLQTAQEKLEKMNTALNEIVNETEKLADGAKKLHDMVTRNKGEFEKVSETVEGIFTSIEEINFASQNLAEAAVELSKKSYEVQRVMSEIVSKHISNQEENHMDKGG
jgi:methyl-accepting chemotaxis protein